MSKKGIIVLGASIIGILLLLIIVVWLMTAVKPKTYSYEAAEGVIVKAAKKYISNNQQLLPASNGTFSLSYQTLVNAGYISPLDELLQDPTGCTTPRILIKKTNNDYSYIVYLNCGTKYVTQEFYKKVLTDNRVVTSGSGLYKDKKGNYFFRGKVNNNYVVFGSTLKHSKYVDIVWKIVGIDSQHNVKLKAVTAITKTKWDDRYNADKSKIVGYNTFDDSILAETLQSLYTNNEVFTNEELSKLKSEKLCIGSRKISDTSKDGNTECSIKSKNEFYFSTITPYEYMRASLDPNCSTLDDMSCSNYNFLSDKEQYSEWSITSDPESTYQSYAFDGSIFTSTQTKNNKNLYVVVKLNEFAFYGSGTGTQTDPYRIKISGQKVTEE